MSLEKFSKNKTHTKLALYRMSSEKKRFSTVDIDIVDVFFQLKPCGDSSRYFRSKAAKTKKAQILRKRDAAE